jgi:DNA-binding NarL/FixJ family response regulator
VLDIHLPDGNGIDVCRALTDADPALPVLLVSADADIGRWAGDCGAVGFMPKAQLASADLVDLLDTGPDEDLSARAMG